MLAMGAWTYTAQDEDVERVRTEIEAQACVYCCAKLHARVDEHDIQCHQYRRRYVTENRRTVKCCPACGWWLVKRTSHLTNDDASMMITDWDYATYGACGVLRAFDVRARTEPLSVIRQYLAAKYDKRFHIDPLRFEDVVVSVYRDFGYDVEATGRTGDGGIDAVLRRGDQTVGVQVKRVRGKIEAEHIRSFAGALYLQGMLAGVYVTTSGFTRGARETAAMAASRIPIVLVDAAKFYDQLGLAQRRTYNPKGELPRVIATAYLHRVQYSSSRP